MSQPIALGIDFGGTGIKPAVIRGAEILERGNVLDTQRLGSPGVITERLAEEIARLRERHPAVAGIGIGLPGMIDAEAGVIHGLSNVPGWENFPLREILRERTGLPVTLENDAKAMAYGEWRHGAASAWRHVICITLGTGVGGGLILDGKLYRGAFNGAGELGQTSIDVYGAATSGVYGNLGALEKSVGNREIAQRASERYRQAGAEKSAEECTPRQLSEAAAAGDAVAREVWETIGSEIGAALVNVIWLLNPECIVIGGGVAKAGAWLFDPIGRTIRERTMALYHEQLAIVPARLGSDAGAIGAAALGAEAAARG